MVFNGNHFSAFYEASEFCWQIGLTFDSKTHSFVNDATNLNIYLKEIVGGFTFLDVSGEGGLGEDPRWDVGGWSSQGCRRRTGCCRCPSAP